MNLDRFAYGLDDPQDYVEKLEGNCKGCGANIYTNDEVVYFEDDMFCDYICLMKSIGAYEGVAGERTKVR